MPHTPSPNRRRASLAVPVLLLAMLATLLAPARPAAADHAPTPGSFATPGQAPPDLDAIDPVRFAYEDAVVEHVQVETRTGAQIWLDIVRPDTDEPVPAIMMSSPYYNTLGRGWRGQLKVPHQGPSFPTSPGVPGLSGDEETLFPEWYDEYFVPRGYAYVAMDLRGTRNSSGCQVYGDRDEVLDTVDVIDWIAEQDWSNGKIGMTGGSYDGTIANGAAAEMPISGKHPDALAAIIPIRAIDRWYDYHFFNGVQSSGHAATPALFTAALAGGDTQNAGTDDLLLPLHVAERKACIATLGAAVDAGYASPYQDADAPFWTERDFTKDAEGMRAAVLMLHGLFDFNVKTTNAGYLWEALPDDLPKRLVLFNGDHADPHLPDSATASEGGHILPYAFREKFVELTHRWYAQHLKGLEAGALRGPEVEVQRADGRFADGGSFPAATDDLALHLSSDGTATADDADEGTVTWADGEASDAPASATFVTDAFDRDTRLSGQVAFDLDLSLQGTDTSVAVDLTVLPPGVDAGETPTEIMDGSGDAPLRIGYGWARAFYRDTIPLRGLSTPRDGAPVTPGERFDLTFGSLYTDVVIPQGSRLALTFSNQAGGTVPAEQGNTVTLHTGPDASRVLVPTAPARRATAAPTAARHAGPDRVATAAAVSRASRGAAATVVVATATDYADALAGSPLAVHLGAPLLLTAPDGLSDAAADEITRLGAAEAVLLGGPVALSREVQDDLIDLGLDVRRIQGQDRYATAAAVAAELPRTDEVFVAEGRNADPARGWPDALAAAGAAASLGHPVLLVERDRLPSATGGALERDTAVTVVGGPAAVSGDVLRAVDQRAGAVQRIAGPDRYATSAAVADLATRRGADTRVTWAASGRNWPDGLTAAAAAGSVDGVLLLVDGQDAAGSPASSSWLRRHAEDIGNLHLAGGPVAITRAVERALRVLVGADA